MSIRAKRAWIVASFAAILLVLVLLLRQGATPWLVRFLRWMDTRPAKTPRAFGLFHFLWVGIAVLLSVFWGILAWRLPRKGREEKIDRRVFLCGVCFFWLEVFKQLLWCVAIFPTGYPFQIFPFQFCSLPLYLCLLAPMMPWRAFRTACYRFLALYGTIGGCLVVGYPAFPELPVLCFHTMIWHSLMIALGVYLLIATRTGKHFLGEWLPATALFLGSFAAATVLNVVLRDLPGEGSGVLNLFYMSPYQSTYFWGISDLWTQFGWGAATAGYLILFSIGAAAPVWFVGRFFCFLQKKNRDAHLFWKKPIKNRKKL